ncbi:(3S,6E)-nerolidol synthase 1 isoform X1 [Amborella trichopoda]|uniref:Uncharacterized protein n=2 Tax=Amborella trichopoda TaxID=13333 RepID=W1P6T9_AMBTC|nr:(3S,6E)-nerolidol synthase 1 isoform X1 [Amborella trichopoda]ERN03389.1 hypothetical protein AMTR_s00003p00254990 [Amborella trichopoda]|eukprot:XP_011622394.2 (3S,6E)-nerolidol synthase 1 isoform X1 [Amborella trichopoda]
MDNVPLPGLTRSTPSFHTKKHENSCDFSNNDLHFNGYEVDFNIAWFNDMKKNLMRMITATIDDTETMVLIDNIQRLSISYHFEAEIGERLDRIYRSGIVGDCDDDLYIVSLGFRLLRQHGYRVSADVFNKFKDESGNFNSCLSKDVIGILSLYEASHLGIQGEEYMDEALAFSLKHLKASGSRLEPELAKTVKHALELPMHFRMPRLESMYYIKVSERDLGRNQDLLEFAVMDFNMVQAMHKQELKEVTRWWRDLGLADMLTFARDKIHEWFMWPVVISSESEFSVGRVDLTKVVAFIHIIDDIYDIYGTLDELQQFTDAIKRWDPMVTRGLPEYMKTCYLVLYDVASDISFKIFKNHGLNVMGHLRQAWTSLCEAFLVEATWFNCGYVPSKEEYLKNGVTSSGVHVALVHAFLLLSPHVTRETVELASHNSQLILSPASILRLWDDLSATVDEKERGYDPSYIECYIKQHKDETEENAKQHTRDLIATMWKKLNQECLDPSPFPHSITKMALNSSRMVQVMYQSEIDSVGSTLKDQMKSLLLEPMSLNS